VIERHVLRRASLVWAVVGLSFGLVALRSANDDARLIVASACVTGPLAAVLASVSLANRRDRLAGVLLIASVVTPTVFAWVFNVPALLIGLVLLTAPVFVVSDGSRPRG
jgi:hypothetical protein